MAYTKLITAMVFLFAFTLEVLACQFAPNTPSNEMGDDLALKGNVIFVGVVSDLDFEQISTEKSCMAVTYTPSEMLLGSKSESFIFKICGADIPQSSASEEFQEWASFMAIGIGNEALVGLTKAPLPNAPKNDSFNSDFRLMYALCYPILFRLDPLPDTERKTILNDFRKQIRGHASN